LDFEKPLSNAAVKLFLILTKKNLQLRQNAYHKKLKEYYLNAILRYY